MFKKKRLLKHWGIRNIDRIRLLILKNDNLFKEISKIRLLTLRSESLCK